MNRLLIFTLFIAMGSFGFSTSTAFAEIVAGPRFDPSNRIAIDGVQNHRDQLSIDEDYTDDMDDDEADFNNP